MPTPPWRLAAERASYRTTSILRVSGRTSPGAPFVTCSVAIDPWSDRLPSHTYDDLSVDGDSVNGPNCDEWGPAALAMTFH